jgi:hypothetical protein
MDTGSLPSTSGYEPDFAAAPDRATELEKQLAASEAARAELIAKLNQVEQALTMTQLSLLNAERRANEAQTRVVQPREDRGRSSPSAAVVSPGRVTVAAHPATDDVAREPEPGRSEGDDEPASEPSSLLSRISALREAVELAADEFDAPPAEDDGVPTFRERLSRAADARHRSASS